MIVLHGATAMSYYGEMAMGDMRDKVEVSTVTRCWWDVASQTENDDFP